MKSKKHLFFISFLFFFNSFLLAQKTNIILLRENEHILTDIPNNSIAYIEDKKSEYHIHQIDSLFSQKNIKTLKKANANFYQTHSAYWFRLNIKQESANIKTDWLLKIDYPLLDYVDFYYQDKNKKWHIKKTGDYLPFHSREIGDKSFLFKLPLQNDTKLHTFYVRIKTNSVLQAPFSFDKAEVYFEHNLGEEIFLFFLYGVFIILILYNLFLYLFIKDFAYLLYVLYISTCTFLLSGIIGHNYQYLFPNSPFLAEITIIPFSCLFFFFLTWFSQYFLYTKKYLPFFDVLLTILKYFILVDMVFYLITFQAQLANRILHLLIFSGLFLIFTTAFYGLYKKIPHSFYFSLAFIFPVLGTFIYVLKLANLIPHTYFTTHITRISLACQGLLFSFALADKYKTIKNQLLESQKNQNEKLELKVKERTQEIDGLNQELLTQNEELQQSQEEILAQREFIQSKNKELTQQATKIQSSIESAKLIQKSILPYTQKKEELLKDYFILYLPKDTVSGDFYWLHKAQNKIFVAVVDCTGHGVPGAFMTLIAHNLLDKIIRIWEIHEPNKILNNLHLEVKNVLQQDETCNNNGMDMSIICIEKIPSNQHKLVFAGAKNDLYYITPDECHIVKELKGDRKSIGGIQNEMISFTNQEIILDKKSLIYLTTDGFLDQNNEKRKKIGLKNWCDFLLECHTKDLDIQKEFLLEKLKNHTKNTTQRDDICVIGFKLT